MKKSGILSGALVLVAITLVSGLLLSAVHEWTRDPIEQADRAAKAEAYRQVYSADAYAEIENVSDLLSQANAALASGRHDEEGVSYRRASVEEAMLAQNKAGQTEGFVLTVASQSGYNGEIRLALGVDPEGAIRGMRVLTHSETAGFGARCEEPGYLETFVGVTAAKDVDAITGATYTTKAIREAVGAGLTFVREYLGEEVTAA